MTKSVLQESPLFIMSLQLSPRGSNQLTKWMSCANIDCASIVQRFGSMVRC
jgi:hypothetical protein